MYWKKTVPICSLYKDKPWNIANQINHSKNDGDMVDKLAKCLLAIFVNQLSCVMYIAMTMTSSFMKRNKKVCVRGNLVSYVIIRFVFCRNGRDEMFTRIMYAEKIRIVHMRRFWNIRTEKWGNIPNYVNSYFSLNSAIQSAKFSFEASYYFLVTPR